MENYIEIFENFKGKVAEYCMANFMQLTESMMTACLFFMQTVFTEMQKYNAGRELTENFGNVVLEIGQGNFTNSLEVIRMYDYVKSEIL